MSAFDFSAEDTQLIGALLAGQVRVVQMPDGSLGTEDGTGSYDDVVAGHQFLMAFQHHPDAIADGQEKWARLAEQVGARTDAMYEERMRTDPGFRDRAFLQYERAYQQGDQTAAELLVEHVQRYGAPTPVDRRLALLPAEERPEAIERLKATAAARGMSVEQHVTALNEAALRGALPELVPSLLSEEQAAKDLADLGLERNRGSLPSQSLGSVFRAQAEGKLHGSRQAPFEPKLSREEQRDKFLESIPRETALKWMRENPGKDPRVAADQALNAYKVATVHDEVQHRLARKDARLPPMPRPTFNESTDRRGDIARAMMAHGVTNPEQLVEKRRHVVGNDRELAIRAAYSEVAGETPEQFEKSTFVPPSVAAEYEDVEVPGRESEDEDNRRRDLERAYQQVEGR